MEKTMIPFTKIKSIILYAMLFLFPLFFLPTTQEFFVTNKLYLLGIGSLALLLTSTVELFVTKKLVWQKKLLDNAVFLFLVSVAASIVVGSPNKIQAILNPNFGLFSIFGLSIVYYYLSRILTQEKKPVFMIVMDLSAFILSVLAIIFFFQPFKNVNLPTSLQFLKSASYTPIGSMIDLAIFLGFFVAYRLSQIIKDSRVNPTDKKLSLANSVYLVVNLVAFSLTLYPLIKANSGVVLTPFYLSWYAAVEILKNPLSALFGIGVDNYASIFTKIKDAAYNQSALWQVYSFNTARSTILHILTETGVFGLLGLGLLIASVIKPILKNRTLMVLGIYLLAVIALLPPSLVVMFLLFVFLTSVASQTATVDDNKSQFSLDLSGFAVLYVGLPVVSLIVIGILGFLIGRSYSAEYFFRQSFNGLEKNNAQVLYENQRQAILINPFIERFRITFSQTNFLIANNIASKTQPTGNNQQAAAQLTDQDKQTISQAIQAAIAEAKAAVALNPAKSSNWENLAAIYRNILNVAQGADVWTISSYQRAILLDPQNPIYRLNLGGVYYSLNNFDESIKLFEQAIALKPEWSNAHYNMAWAAYQKADYQTAAAEMQNVISLLDPKRDQADYDRAQKDLTEFKKKLPKEETTASQPAANKPAQLVLPTAIPSISPIIKLPKEASPEAK